jgi:PAS domain S-box-containing protein
MKLRAILLILYLLAFFSATSGGYLYYSSLNKSAFIEAETQAGSHAEISKSISDPIIRTVGYTILALCVLIGLSVLVLYNLAKSDIVKRMKAEEALRESEEKYRSMMEAMTDAAYICSHDFRVEYMNPAMIKRIGHDDTGGSCYQAINGLEEKCPWCVHHKVQKGEHAVTEIVSPKDNRTYSVSHSPIHHVDGTISKLTIYRDLTELKKMEAELLKARKLESIGLLAGGMAHDFNNLLSIIMGNISMVQDDVKPEDQIGQLLNDAQEASRRAQELTRQLITFSKGGAPVKQLGSIKDLLKEIIIFIPADSNVKCEFSIPPDLSPVEFDEGQMQHAFKNLIINAAESMPESGLIKVRAENLIFKSEIEEKSLALAAGEYVKISIQDHGVGICSENLALIFDPYFSTKEMGTQKGMGMGLATTYSIIKKHGGNILVESEVDAGTTATIYLPAYVKKAQKIEPIETQKLPKTAIRTRKILLMDDEKSIRHIAKHMLSRLDYDAETAKDGVEAIALFKRAMDSDKPIDVVILDLTIKGGMGGKDVIKILQKIDPQVKAIVSSGYCNDPVMTDCKKYGFAGALPKPYAKKDLKDMLHNIL